MKTKSNYYTLILHLVDSINAHLNIINKNFYSNLILVFFGVLFLSISSYIKIPFYPVPLTMQTLAVLLIAMSYGFSRGTLTVSTYLSLGFVGVPVFASGSGIAYMFTNVVFYMSKVLKGCPKLLQNFSTCSCS